MRVLFDQGTPVPVRHFLPRHSVRTAAQEGWATLVNGVLLTAAEAAGSDVFLTTDKNLKHQQNLQGRRISMVVTGAAQWRGLEPHVALAAAIDRATPDSFDEVEIPTT